MSLSAAFMENTVCAQEALAELLCDMPLAEPSITQDFYPHEIMPLRVFLALIGLVSEDPRLGLDSLSR